MRPISETSSNAPSPWIYDQDSYQTVLKDILAVRNIDSEKQKAAWEQKQKLQKLQEYEADTKKIRDAFLAKNIIFARTGTLKQIEQALRDTADQQRLLEDEDSFDQLYKHELQLLQKSLEQRKGILTRNKERQEKQNLVSTINKFKSYLETTRKVPVYQTQEDLLHAVEGKVKPSFKLQPAVKTEVSPHTTEPQPERDDDNSSEAVSTEEKQLDTLEEWQASAEFESYLDRVSVSEMMKTEEARQGIMQEIASVSIRNQISRGVSSQEKVEETIAKGLPKDEELDEWFKDKDLTLREKNIIEIKNILQDNEARTRALIDGNYGTGGLKDTIPTELIIELYSTQEESIRLRKLQTSAEVIEKVLFSQEDPLSFIRDFLTRPDIKKSLLFYVDLRAEVTWNEKKRAQPKDKAFFEQFHHKLSEYRKAQREAHEEKIASKNLITDAYLLTYLGVDMDLLIQALEARQQNSTKPFSAPEKAAEVLFGLSEKQAHWWKDVQKTESKNRVLFQLTQAYSQSRDGSLLFLDQGSQTSFEQRMNFVHALHLKVGLDTPSKFVDYDKANEIVITQHSEQCIQMLNQLLLVRGELQSDDYQEQLEHFKKNSELIRHNLPKFAQSYMRLNQALGDITGRSIDEKSPARQFLTEIYVGGAEKGSRGKHLGALVAFLDFGLADWLKENKAPHETIFETRENEQERMS